MESGGNHPVVRCVVSVIALFALGGRGASAQALDLKRLAKDLNLTSAGARQWLGALGVDSTGNSGERLLAVTLDNKIVAKREGTAQHVSVGRDLDLLLLKPSPDIVLIHNHPDNVGFSRDDLIQLEKPGVAAVVALGHDGSVYMASRGPRYDRDLFEPSQYDVARAAALRGAREALASHTLSNEAVNTQLAHVVSLALAHAGVIQYYAVLAPSRRTLFDNARVTWLPVIAAATSRVH